MAPATSPDRDFLAERRTPGADWTRITYAGFERAMRVRGPGVAGPRAFAERPVGDPVGCRASSTRILAYAAMHVGIPYVPISPAYSLLSPGLRASSRHVLDLLTPGLIFCDDHAAFAPAIWQRLARRLPKWWRPDPRDAAPTPLRTACLPPRPSEAVEAAARRVGPDHGGQDAVHLRLDRACRRG